MKAGWPRVSNGLPPVRASPPLSRRCVQQARPNMRKSLRSSRAGTCATNCSATPIGRAWRTVSKSECRSWTLHCLRTSVRPLRAPLRQPNATLPLVGVGYRSRCAIDLKLGSLLPFGNGSQQARKAARVGGYGTGLIRFTANLERTPKSILAPCRLDLQPEDAKLNPGANAADRRLRRLRGHLQIQSRFPGST